MGGGGLYGTAPDYLKFTQMILNRAAATAISVLKPETVALMGQNHIGELNITQDERGDRPRSPTTSSCSRASTRNGA